MMMMMMGKVVEAVEKKSEVFGSLAAHSRMTFDVV